MAYQGMYYRPPMRNASIRQQALATPSTEADDISMLDNDASSTPLDSAISLTDALIH
jgi:hypothetical protein